MTGRRGATPAARPSSLRVAMVTDHLPLGGAESLQLSILAGLDRTRFAAEVICLRSAGAMAPRFEASGVPVTVLGRRGARHLATPLVLAREFRRRGIDVVLLTTHDAAFVLTPFAARLAGVPVAVGVHQIGGKHIGIPNFPRGGVDLMWLIDALVLLTPAQGDYLREEEGLGRFPWRRVRRAVIPNGIAVPPRPGGAEVRRARAALGLRDSELAVGMVAALRAEKKHDLLLRAAARLVPEHPGLRVELIGSGARDAELRRLAEALGIAGRVRFHGFRDDIPALLPGLDVVCLTSEQETFPMSVLEAMAAARPVVATDPPGVPPIVVDRVTGHLVPVGDEDALVDRLGRLLSDPGLREDMGARGYERVSRDFPVARTLGRYEELFTRLADRRTG